MPVSIEERDARSSLIVSRLQAGGRVHMIGIGGVGMAGVAWLLRQRGFEVEGCDADDTSPTVAWLRGEGIEVMAGHGAAHLSEAHDWVIRSNAVGLDAPEVVAAAGLGIAVDVRGEVLPRLLDGERVVAVAGTHGKTTTATLSAHVLRHSGVDGVRWCIGAMSDTLGAVAGGVGDGPIVVEADESDGTLALYRSHIAVVTNVEFDHMEHFVDGAAFEACFSRFVGQAEGVVYCGDDAGASAICGQVPGAISYGLGDGSALCGDIEATGSGWQDVVVSWHGERWGAFRLPFTGVHNVQNALAACAVALVSGASAEDVCRALGSVSLPSRRFECVAECGGILVFSDYAHHPSELVAALEMGRGAVGEGGKLRVVFQPHRYTRTRALLADFPVALGGADEVVLVPVYPASEAPLAGGRIEDLYAACREGGVEGVALCESLHDAWAALATHAEAGDVLMLVGAGSVGALASEAAAWAESGRLSGRAGIVRMAESSPVQLLVQYALGARTTYGVGGRADMWCVAESLETLRQLSAWTAREGVSLTVLGAGSNVLIPDTGVRGLVVRLGDAFRGVVLEGTELCVGGGASIAALVDAARRCRAAGYSRLTGIPGSVGGAVAMNAGAHGVCMADLLCWVEGVDRAGHLVRLEIDSLAPGYHTMAGLEGICVTRVGLRVVPAAVGEWAEAEAFIERRRWQRGVRCAGSVFRNPPGQSAGRLVEGVFSDGAGIGGARIMARHANFIEASRGASASDVVALMRRVAARVHDSEGGELSREVRVLGWCTDD
jgi:UDP-N-acetylmuramate--alanine ligase